MTHLAAAVVLPTLLLCLPVSTHPQAAGGRTLDDDCAAAAYAPDGRLGYAIRRLITVRRIEMQRDDMFVVGSDGKKKRIVNGERLVRGNVPFSYAVQSLRWSPDGTKLAVEMFTSQFIDAKGDTQEGELTLLLDEEGKEIKIQGGDSGIPEAYHATWLADGVTVAYLVEAVKPKLLYSIRTIRPVSGRGGAPFSHSAFSAVAWDAKHNAAVAVERDASLHGPARLVWLDLLKEQRRELGELDGYLGQLTLSPSGGRVAFFRDGDTLEVREIADPQRSVQVHVGFGTYQWAPDERRLLIKRAPEKKSGDLAWVTLPATATGARVETNIELVLHDLTFRDFALAPDGRSLAVIEPGNRRLVVYPLAPVR